MINSAIIEVIIGLIFVYSLLSIMVTQINSVIANTLNWRAKDLRRSVREMLTDPEIHADFVRHPLIQMVHIPTGDYRGQAARGSETLDDPSQETKQDVTVGKSVTWVTPTLFSQVMVNILTTKSTREIFGPLALAVNDILEGSEQAVMRETVRRLQSGAISIAQAQDLVNRLNEPADRDRLTAELGRLESFYYSGEDGKLIALLQGLRKVKDARFQKAMDALLATANTVQEARDNIELWFNDSMNLVTNTYKRNLQAVSLGIGFILALVLNVDTLQLARSLWDDPALRETVALAAQTSLQTGQLGSQLQTDAPPAQDSALIPVPGPEATPDPAVEAQTQQALQQSVVRTQDTIQDLLSLRLPIGWTIVTPAQASAIQLGGTGETAEPIEGNPCVGVEDKPDFCGDTRNLWNLLPGNNDGWFGILLLKVIGLVVTTIAVAQGAPFWFDLLNRVARGRSGVG